jgi:ribonuclease P protein component
VGNAVQRNRAKRLMREAVKPFLSSLSPGASLLLIGRSPLVTSNLADTTLALQVLFNRAKLFDQLHDS